MVRLKAPMFSANASGSLAKTLTVSSWKGRSYAKKISMPTNNDQPLQQAARRGMEFLAQQWTLLSPPAQATWEEEAERRNISPFDQYVSINLARIAENKGPTQDFPATETMWTPVVIFSTDHIFYSHVQLEVGITGPGSPWGVNLYRNNVDWTDHDRRYLVKTIQYANIPTTQTVDDVPPSRGTWWYLWSPFNTDGSIKADNRKTSVVW